MLSSARARPPWLWRPISSTSTRRFVQRSPFADDQLKEASGKPPTTTTEAPRLPEASPPTPDSDLSGSSSSTHPGTSIPLDQQLDSTSSSESRTSESTKDRLSSQSPASESGVEIFKKRLGEWTEQTTINLRHRADDFTARSKTTFSQLGAELNKVTGYEEIEALKRGVVEQEQRIHEFRQAAREAKKAYEAAVLQRSDSQREVNELLQRKSIWTATDVSRFTELIPKDHLHQQQELQAKKVADEAEEGVEKEFAKLMRLILARYHEEQVWSDKIRSASTYGSLVALGLNMMVFVVAILLVEPWKRRRLAQTFEDKIVKLSEENARRLEQSMKVVDGRIERQEALLDALKLDVLQGVQRLVEPPVLVEVLDEPPPGMGGVDVPSTNTHFTSRRNLELAVVGAGAFTIGILGTLLFGR